MARTSRAAERVTAIPGNHDAYVRLHPELGTDHWQPFMESNEAGEALFPTPPTAFPFVRRFGDVALVALSSAIPTMPFIAAGKIGSAQRALLAGALDDSPARACFAWCSSTTLPLRRPGRLASRLARRRQVTSVLKQQGAELVLHGHNHAQTRVRARRP